MSVRKKNSAYYNPQMQMPCQLYISIVDLVTATIEELFKFHLHIICSWGEVVDTFSVPRLPHGLRGFQCYHSRITNIILVPA